MIGACGASIRCRCRQWARPPPPAYGGDPIWVDASSHQIVDHCLGSPFRQVLVVLIRSLAGGVTFNDHFGGDIGLETLKKRLEYPSGIGSNGSRVAIKVDAVKHRAASERRLGRVRTRGGRPVWRPRTGIEPKRSSLIRGDTPKRSVRPETDDESSRVAGCIVHKAALSLGPLARSPSWSGISLRNGSRLGRP